MTESLTSNPSYPWSTWWERKKPLDAGKALVAWNDECIKQNAPKAARSYIYAQTIENRRVELSNLAAFGDLPDFKPDGDVFPITVNKCAALLRTFISKVFAGDTPLPQHVTNDADYEQQLRAENLDEAIRVELQSRHGMFADCSELDRQGGTIAVGATGEYWVFAFPGEGKVDAQLDDGMTIGVVRGNQFGPIQTLSRSTWWDPEALKQRYPRRAAEIDACVDLVEPGVISGGKEQARARNNDMLRKRRMVRVVQGWRVAFKSKRKTIVGREMFVLKTGVHLEDNDWPWDEPPGDRWVFELQMDGEGGIPLTESIYRLDMRKNQMIYEADRTEYNTPHQTWLCQKGTGEAESVKGQLSGAVGVKIVEISGSPASALKVQDSSGIKRNALQLIEMYDAATHEVTGISRANVGGASTGAASSGIHEVWSASYFTERYADCERRLVQFRTVTRARKFARALKSVAAGKYSVWVGDKKKRRQLKPRDFDLPDDKYTIEVKPTSEEKDSPASRLKKIEKLASDPASMVSGKDLVDAMKTFDTDRAASEFDALDDWTREQINTWYKSPLEELPALYMSPLKWFGIPVLESALRITSLALIKAMQDKLPPERQDYFTRYADECTALIDAAKQKELDMQARAQAGAKAAAAQPPPPAGAAVSVNPIPIAVAGAAPGPGASPGPGAGPAVAA